jgi:23S rRNA (cytosine1962-C5)-methyltransferase
MNHLPSGGLLLTSSCSQHIDKQLFQTIVFQAAKDSGRTVRIIGFHELAKDHPVSIFFPEGDYLKSLFLYIE